MASVVLFCAIPANVTRGMQGRRARHRRQATADDDDDSNIVQRILHVTQDLTLNNAAVPPHWMPEYPSMPDDVIPPELEAVLAEVRAKKAAQRKERRRQKAAAEGRIIVPRPNRKPSGRQAPLSHGSAGYRRGCQCAECVEGYRTARREPSRRNAKPQPIRPEPACGTRERYNSAKYRCRCPDCREANRKYVKAKRKPFTMPDAYRLTGRMGFRHGKPIHGTASTWKTCECEVCRIARSLYWKDYRRRQKLALKHAQGGHHAGQ